MHAATRERTKDAYGLSLDNFGANSLMIMGKGDVKVCGDLREWGPFTGQESSCRGAFLTQDKTRQEVKTYPVICRNPISEN